MRNNTKQTLQHRLESLAVWQSVFLYSVYQAVILAFLVFSSWRSWKIAPWIVDVTRSNCLLIAISWLVLYGVVGPSAPAQFYERRLALPKKPWLRRFVRFFDVLLHLVPVFLLGLPLRTMSVLYAIAMMGFWYLVSRPYILHFLQYVPVRFTDVLLYMLYPATVLAWLVLPFQRTF